MTRLTSRDGWLHYEDGTHRSTAPNSEPILPGLIYKADVRGSDLEKFERAITRHMARHAEEEEE